MSDREHDDWMRREQMRKDPVGRDRPERPEGGVSAEGGASPQGRPPEQDRTFGGSAGYGYGDGGYSAFGQITQGGSDRADGGFGGGAGGQGLNSQWGQAGYGPLNQGLSYSQGGGRFGAAGYGQPDYGYDAGDHHDHSYRRWRDAQIDTHDRDYARWRAEQVRRYDEEYSAWRNDRHAAFSREFEGWRSNRGNVPDEARRHQPSPPPGVTGSAHGANPALADIADGGTGAGRDEARREAKAAEHDKPRH